MMNLNTQVALVTGGNRGIGRSIVESLLHAGVKKVYLGARNPATAQDLAKQHGSRVHLLTLDVTNAQQVDDAVRLATDVTLLINNAGYLTPTNATATDAEKNLATELDVNVYGLIRTTRAFLPALVKHHGTVVNINSIASFINFPGLATYSLSKAAAWSLTQAQRNELVPQGVRVIGVYPGPIDTDMAKDAPFDKEPPSVVANALLSALSDGTNEVFPDAMARNLWDAFRGDVIAATHQFASATPQPASH